MDGRPTILELVGGFASAIAISQLFISQDRLVETLGGFISLHSIFWGVAVVGAMLLMPRVVHAIRWVWDIPKRLRQEEQDNELKGKVAVIKQIRDLKRRIENPSGFLFQNKDVDVVVLKQTLINSGVVHQMFGTHSDVEWVNYLDSVLPHIVRHGIEQGVAKYERDRDRDFFDDDGDDE